MPAGRVAVAGGPRGEVESVAAVPARRHTGAARPCGSLVWSRAQVPTVRMARVSASRWSLAAPSVRWRGRGVRARGWGRRTGRDSRACRRCVTAGRGRAWAA